MKIAIFGAGQLAMMMIQSDKNHEHEFVVIDPSSKPPASNYAQHIQTDYADPKTLGKTGGVITNDMNGPEIYGTIFSLVPSSYDENTLWAGSDDGLVHITQDHGKSWRNITPPDMPKDTRISIIEESKHKAGTVYIAAKRYQMDDRKPYLWKTNDYGKTWSKIINGIRTVSYTHLTLPTKRIV